MEITTYNLTYNTIDTETFLDDAEYAFEVYCKEHNYRCIRCSRGMKKEEMTEIMNVLTKFNLHPNPKGLFIFGIFDFFVIYAPSIEDISLNNVNIRLPFAFVEVKSDEDTLRQSQVEWITKNSNIPKAVVYIKNYLSKALISVDK